MVSRIKLVLEQAEYSALLELAVSELRAPTEEAHYILREALVQRGYLRCSPNRAEVAPTPPTEVTNVRTG
jgi:hypothetical protein